MEMATATTTTAGRKSPDPECETPTRIQPGKPVSVSNGVLKRHNNHHHHRSPPLVKVYYKECLKNHAASIGGHALDGCGEFMPSPGSSSADPTSLKCAACGCHRNFHSREPNDSPPLPLALPPPSATTGHHAIEYHPHHRHHPPPPPRSPSSASPPPISSSYYPHSAPHMLVALSSPPESHPHPPPTNAVVHRGNGSRKRFRTKFTQNQKERMLEFAEQLGWKVQKKDEETIQEFCHEVGVDRNVLKVWMHNNKNTFGSKSKEGLPAINGSGGIDLDDHVGRSGSMAHMGTNGSSSSS